jgi:hypothetical protein
VIPSITTRRAWRRVVRGVLLALIALVLLFPPLYALAMPEERGPLAALPAIPARTYRVYVANWGYHATIIVEQPSGWSLGPPGKERAPFLEYAWGDRRFYMDSDYRPQSLFATVVLPTESVIYLDGQSDPPSLVGARAAYARTVDAATLRTLLLDLERSFQRTPLGARLPPYPAVRGYSGRFYSAHGHYLWTRDCNWWTIARLATAGAARSGTGVVFSGQVGGRLRGFAELSLR